MVQSGGIHYLGKSYDELRMIYYDLRRRTTEKLKKLEEQQQEGEEGSRKTTVTLNEVGYYWGRAKNVNVNEAIIFSEISSFWTLLDEIH